MPERLSRAEVYLSEILSSARNRKRPRKKEVSVSVSSLRLPNRHTGAFGDVFLSSPWRRVGRLFSASKRLLFRHNCGGCGLGGGRENKNGGAG
uniref:Uncharacterized protein n=1 Tax=Magnetococcus massalia (strain MO-1) TaxID=451514 RepID=A0A1S7LPQ2_MAGMO|nr:protein of unknown function [Candidatus Magnetococcus massalia]